MIFMLLLHFCPHKNSDSIFELTKSMFILFFFSASNVHISKPFSTITKSLLVFFMVFLQ